MHPSTSRAELLSLRLKYSAAYGAYRSSVDTLCNVSRDGEKLSPEQLQKEATAMRAVTVARANLLAAMRGGPAGKSA